MSLKWIIRRCGLEVNRYRVGTSNVARLARVLSSSGIDVVLDVGANSGQFAVEIRAAGYRGRIVSFEPLSTAYRALLERSARDERWIVAPRMAIGSEDAVTNINVAANSYSSSILPVLDAHVRSDASAAFVGQESARLARLDTVAGEYVSAGDRCFVKIDTQGFEAHVLSGASVTLRRATGVQLELSLVPLYGGQATYLELIERMGELGFALWGVVPGFADESTGRLLQMDGVFLRDGSQAGSL